MVDFEEEVKPWVGRGKPVYIDVMKLVNEGIFEACEVPFSEVRGRYGFVTLLRNRVTGDCVIECNYGALLAKRWAVYAKDVRLVRERKVPGFSNLRELDKFILMFIDRGNSLPKWRNYVNSLCFYGKHIDNLHGGKIYNVYSILGSNVFNQFYLKDVGSPRNNCFNCLSKETVPMFVGPKNNRVHYEGYELKLCEACYAKPTVRRSFEKAAALGMLMPTVKLTVMKRFKRAVLGGFYDSYDFSSYRHYIDENVTLEEFWERDPLYSVVRKRVDEFFDNCYWLIDEKGKFYLACDSV